MDYQEDDFQYQDNKRKNDHPPRWLELLLKSPVIAALVAGLFCFSISVVITANVDINKLLNDTDETKTPIAQIESPTSIVVTATSEPQDEAPTQTPTFTLAPTSTKSLPTEPPTPIPTSTTTTSITLSCSSPVPPSAEGSRITYTEFYSDLYKLCGWAVTWNTLVVQGTVSGQPPEQRPMGCYGSGYSQFDDYTCTSSYGVDTFILSTDSTVTVNDPHCISFAPNISPTNITANPNTKTASGSDGVSILTTNVQVTGDFTLFIWCVANWE